MQGLCTCSRAAPQEHRAAWWDARVRWEMFEEQRVRPLLDCGGHTLGLLTLRRRRAPTDATPHTLECRHPAPRLTRGDLRCAEPRRIRKATYAGDAEPPTEHPSRWACAGSRARKGRWRWDSATKRAAGGWCGLHSSLAVVVRTIRVL